MGILQVYDLSLGIIGLKSNEMLRKDVSVIYRLSRRSGKITQSEDLHNL